LLFDDLFDNDKFYVFAFHVVPDTTKSRLAGPATYTKIKLMYLYPT